MVFISLTRLKVRSLFFLPAFFRANEAAVKELIKTKGFITGVELIDKGPVFWTITCWNGETDMKSFRNGPAHRKAMQKLPDWCCEATYTHWLQEDVPTTIDWKLMHEKIVQDGKLTKVRKPTQNHPTKEFPVIKWLRLQRPLKALS